MPAITKGALASVYVLRRHRNGRPAKAYNRPATWSILNDFYDDLPDEAKKRFDALDDAEEAHSSSRKSWASSFIDALDRGVPGLPRQRGTGVVDRHAPSEDMTTRELALRALWAAKDRGLTVNEVKGMTGVASDGISGALSELVGCGIAVRLAEKR